MHRSLQWLVALVLVAPLTITQAQENNRPPAGFTALFNARDLQGWHGEAEMSPLALQAMPAAFSRLASLLRDPLRKDP